MQAVLLTCARSEATSPVQRTNLSHHRFDGRWSTETVAVEAIFASKRNSEIDFSTQSENHGGVERSKCGANRLQVEREMKPGGDLGIVIGRWIQPSASNEVKSPVAYQAANV